MTKNCQKCKIDFQITKRDLDFYARLPVPPPTWCFDCRMQRKMQFRNYQNLTQRACSKCGEKMISMYPETSKAIVWCESCWKSDSWSAEDFALEYDFSQPFFKQFAQLLYIVPQQHLYQKNNENCPWVNGEAHSKNCYLNFCGIENQNGAYNHWSGFTSNCLDNYALLESQNCYETTVATKCYQTFFSIFVFDCTDVLYSENCSNCSNLIGCINLKNKSYQIFNQSVTQEEFQVEVEKLKSYSYQQDFLHRFSKFRLTQIHQPTHGNKTTDSIGDYLENSHDCVYCFDSAEAQSCTYSFGIGYIKDCYDIFSGSLGMELCYEYAGGGEKCYRVMLSTLCANSHDIYYSHGLVNCSNCFGCIGLKNKQFCIFNTQFTEAEYKMMILKIIQSMKDFPYIDSVGRTYGFGEFFPGEISPFAYNDSFAQDYFPLTQSEATSNGFQWRNTKQHEHIPTIIADHLPDMAKQADSSLLNEVISCVHQGTCTDHCSGVFTIIQSELQFLQKFGLPLPRMCPNCRHIRRIKQKNPKKLWERTCQCGGRQSVNTVYNNVFDHKHGALVCSNSFSTTLAPERPETVYCQDCFLAETV